MQQSPPHMPIQSAINKAMKKKSPKILKKKLKGKNIKDKPKEKKEETKKEEEIVKVAEEKKIITKDNIELIEEPKLEEDNNDIDLKLDDKNTKPSINSNINNINNININLHFNNNTNQIPSYYLPLTDSSSSFIPSQPSFQMNPPSIPSSLSIITPNTSLLNTSVNSSNSNNSHQKKSLDSSAYTNIPPEQLASNLYILAKDQGGCRYLQKLLDEDPIKITNIFYQPLLDNILKLVNDPFGNYLIQKMFASMSQEQIH